MLFEQIFTNTFLCILIYVICVFREILEADADAIVLSRWNPFYYELGMHVRKFSGKDSEIIAESLLQVSEL